MDTTAREPVLVDLALQGGGSHGAFTWGVLDRLLEEPWLQIEAISGTSAGAMNAAVLADGWTEGGAEGARAALDAYWERVARGRALQPAAAHAARPDARPLDARPLAGLHRHRPDVAAVLALRPQSRAASIRCAPSWTRASISSAWRDRPIKLFITATNVRTGRGRIFRNAEITPDVLLASACLPTMFQAVEIDGEAYWDGGYAGNPDDHAAGARERRAGHDPGPDQSARAPGTPRTAREILNRLNEVSFNAR